MARAGHRYRTKCTKCFTSWLTSVLSASLKHLVMNPVTRNYVSIVDPFSFSIARASALLVLRLLPSALGGNNQPPASARQQPVQSLATAVDFAAVDFHLFDKEDLFSASSSWQRLGA
jgi:hypothetical protein